MKQLQEANQELERLHVEMKEIAEERIRMAKANHKISRTVKKAHQAFETAKKNAPANEPKPAEGEPGAKRKKPRRVKKPTTGQQPPDSLRASSGPVKTNLPSISEQTND